MLRQTGCRSLCRYRVFARLCVTSRASFASKGMLFPFMCHDDRAFLYGDVATVLCEEELDTGHLVATNIFVREGKSWRMVHHQASPILIRYHEEDTRRPNPSPRH